MLEDPRADAANGGSRSVLKLSQREKKTLAIPTSMDVGFLATGGLRGILVESSAERGIRIA